MFLFVNLIFTLEEVRPSYEDSLQADTVLSYTGGYSVWTPVEREEGREEEEKLSSPVTCAQPPCPHLFVHAP